MNVHKLYKIASEVDSTSDVNSVNTMQEMPPKTRTTKRTIVLGHIRLINIYEYQPKKASEYDQETPQSNTANHPMAT